MPRKSKRPLEKRGREILFYEGDWSRLGEILAIKKIPPGVFIREMVSKIIRRAEEGAQMKSQDVDLDEVEVV